MTTTSPLFCFLYATALTLGMLAACVAEDGSGGELDVCEQLASEDDPAGPYAIELVNKRDIPLFVGPIGCGNLGYVLYGPSGELERTRKGACQCSCPALIDDAEAKWDCLSCSSDCGPDVPYLRLEPGESYEAEWQGEVFADDRVPMSCNEELPQDLNCVRVVEPLAGTWTVETSLYDTVSDCFDGEADCTCADGVEPCLVYPGTLGAETRPSAEFSVPDQQMVTLEL